MPAAAVDRPRSRVETEVLRARGLLAKNQFAEALSVAGALLDQVPENRDVLYIVAVSQRYLRRLGDALATLARFAAVHPGYSRLYQERGHCYVAAGDGPAALEAYLHAVNLNPSLPASWQALQVLFRAAGATADADMAGRHVAKLAALPVAIVTASSMFADGEVHPAEHLVRQHLLTHPEDIEGMRLLAQIGMKLDILDDAEFLLESVLAFAPDYQAARYDYARVLLQRHRHARALEEIDTLLKGEPGNRAYRTTRATITAGLGDHAGALRAYQELAAETPAAPDLHLSIAHALKTLGRQTEAIDSYRRAAAVAPSYGDAYWSLANLKTYRFTETEIARMRVEVDAPATGPVDRYHLCFALGKALEDAGAYEESFACYARGNALKKAETRYDPGPVERNAELQKALCTREFFAARSGAGGARPAREPERQADRLAVRRAVPIFIVGLPRAGSTLLEQILASHSQVEGTMELADIPRLVAQLQGRDSGAATPRYPGVLADLTPAQCAEFGAGYLDSTAIYRTGKRFFIDKMPNNFRHIGLIHLILPNAKIIDARRDALACCFSNFKQLFASGQEFTYSLEDIGRYYRSYRSLMEHWDTVLPGKVLRVQYEALVADLEGNVRRVLEFCGLEFETGCLEFHKNGRSVRTASSEQVRRPIYTTGLDQWRAFEPWLQPLQAALNE